MDTKVKKLASIVGSVARAAQSVLDGEHPKLPSNRSLAFIFSEEGVEQVESLGETFDVNFFKNYVNTNLWVYNNGGNEETIIKAISQPAHNVILVEMKDNIDAQYINNWSLLDGMNQQSHDLYYKLGVERIIMGNEFSKISGLALAGTTLSPEAKLFFNENITNVEIAAFGWVRNRSTPTLDKRNTTTEVYFTKRNADLTFGNSLFVFDDWPTPQPKVYLPILTGGHRLILDLSQVEESGIGVFDGAEVHLPKNFTNEMMPQENGLVYCTALYYDGDASLAPWGARKWIKNGVEQPIN